MRHHARPGITIHVAAAYVLAALITGTAANNTHAAPPARPAPGVMCGGDPPLDFLNPAHTDNCVPAALQLYVNEHSARNARRLGLIANDKNEGGIASSVPPPYAFFPIAGRTDHGDTFIGQFVDVNTLPTVAQDYQCRGTVGEGHAGHDAGVLTFAHQAIGVPVFAARDGTVVFAQDGWPDMNLSGGVQGNIVAINHGGSPPVESQYYHLKNGSVAVTVGQVVKAGQQIGMAASSGNSFGPHLHFQTMVDGQVYEPFAGACRAGASGWADQAPLDTDDLFLDDFGITKTNLNSLANPWWQPWEIPCDSQWATGDPEVFFYWDVYNFPVDCPFSVKFFRPDNSQAWDYTWHWGNTELFRHQKSWFGFNFQDMGPVPGTWRIDFSLNGQLMISAPFEVVAGPADPSFNRPPQPILAAFDPPAPSNADAVFCRVSNTLAKEDLDWDIVRYRYVWKVNGVTVRDVTNATLADAIPHHLACGGSTLSCTVTASDGVASAAPANVNVIVSGPHGPDVNCSGHVDVDDLIAVILGWGPCPVPPNACAADTNSSGAVDVDDLIAVILNWG